MVVRTSSLKNQLGRLCMQSINPASYPLCSGKVKEVKQTKVQQIDGHQLKISQHTRKLSGKPMVRRKMLEKITKIFFV